jgi:hypothetical protein
MCMSEIDTFLDLDVICPITININFRLLAEAPSSLSLQTITPDSSPNLSDVLIAWYEYEQDGIPVFHRNDEDKTLFPRVHRRFPTHGDRALSIGELVNRLKRGVPLHPFHKPMSMRQDPPATGLYPAYNVGNNRLLLLNGAHRCISSVRDNTNYKIDLIVIDGPITGDISPDLSVFQNIRGPIGKGTLRP